MNKHFSVFSLAILVGLLLTSPFSVMQQSQTATVTANSDGANAPRIIGYFVQWGVYSRNYRVKQVDTSGAAAQVTHLNYAFGNVSTDYKCYEETRAGWGDGYADYGMLFKAADSVDGVADSPDQPLKGNFNQLRKLKAKYPQLKLMISIGGWTWSGRFSGAAKPENRVAFVKSCIDLYLRGTIDGQAAFAGLFDGIDIDWEYPAAPGFEGDPQHGVPPNVYSPADTQNYTALLAEFRHQLDAFGAETGKHYPLSIAVPTADINYNKIELKQVAVSLDWINLMAYDMHGAWNASGPTDFQAPLYASPDDPSPLPERNFSVDSTVKDFLKQGVPADKIVIGVPFYGRGWTGVPDQNKGLYQSAASMKAAPATYEDGVEDYKVLKALKAPTFRDPKTQAFWSFDGSNFWSYDDPVSIATKMTYIKQNKLGGAMFWSIDGDDGTLVNAIYSGLK